MARRRHRPFLTLGLSLGFLPALAVVSAHAQTPAPSPSPSPRGGAGQFVSAAPVTGGGVGVVDGKIMVEVRPQPPRAFFDRLPPGEREAFERNLRLWRELSPEEREDARALLQRRTARRRAEAERVLAESGLQLDADRREVFVLRYQQERRKLERELRQKIEAERAVRLPEIAAQLRREFSGPPPELLPPRGPQVPFMR